MQPLAFRELNVDQAAGLSPPQTDDGVQHRPVGLAGVIDDQYYLPPSPEFQEPLHYVPVPEVIPVPVRAEHRQVI